MGSANSILVVSDKQDDILKFRSKLVHLRDINSVIGTTVDKAVEFCRKYIPDTVIVFVHEKNNKLFEICKAIRLDSILKNTPIIFIFDIFDEEFILSSFDAGISDYVMLPARESDLLMRIIWSLQKSENARELEKKEMLLRELGVTDKVTGAYTASYISRVFTNEINSARKYKYPIVLMTVCLDIIHKNKINDTSLAGIIRKSTRNSDVLGIPERGKFYIILPKTSVKGACAVYSRIIKNLGENLSISAGICESFDNMNYETLSNCAINALNEAIKRGGNRVIVYDKPDEEEIKDQKNEQGWIDKVQSGKKNYEQFKQDFSKRADCIISPLFRRIQNDLKIKYSDNLVIEQFITDTKCYFLIKQPYEEKEAMLKIVDPGFSKVIIENTINNSGSKKNMRSTIDIKDLTEENITKILQNLYKQFQEITETKE